MKLTGRLWPLKMKHSLLHSLLHRSNCSQPGGIFLTFFAYYCRVWHQREEVMRQAEAGCVWWIARWRYHEPWERFYCTVCTLCIYTWDTRWCTGSRQCTGNAGGGGGFAVLLKDSLMEVEGAGELTLVNSRWFQPVTFQPEERHFKAAVWHWINYHFVHINKRLHSFDLTDYEIRKSEYFACLDLLNPNVQIILFCVLFLGTIPKFRKTFNCSDLCIMKKLYQIKCLFNN